MRTGEPEPTAWLDLRVPPPVVALAAAALMWLVAGAATALPLDAPGRVPLAIAIAVAGLGFDAAALAVFVRARTTINPMRPDSTSALVATGVYRLTRNPMYVGLVLVLTGWAVFLGDALVFVFPPAVAFFLDRFQIRPEERILAAKFGPAYDEYRARVRRWI